MTDWHRSQVASSAEAAEGLTIVCLTLPGPSLARAYTTPGQYVRLSMSGLGEGHFAIASPPLPSATHFDFLVKDSSPLSAALVRAAPGTEVLLTSPAGAGFPLERARGKNLLLFATGSGISPIHALLQVVRRERRAFGAVTLYFGARTPAGFAYARDIDSWEREDIQVVRTVSRPGESGWPGLTGYVQSHLGQVPVEDAVAFISGQKGMVQGVRDALGRRGMSKEDIFLNY